MDLKNIYNKYYKILVLIPLIILALDIAIIGMNYSKTGDILNKDVSLKGGTTATIYTEQKFEGLESFLKQKFPLSDIQARELTEFGTDKTTGMIIEATQIKSDELKTAIESQYNIKLTQDIFSIEEVGSSLGESFYRQMMVAMALAFLFMSITVFIIFRNFVPSIAVVMTALVDIVTTLAIINITGMKISTAGIAALLMLIGYSIDTDMLLTTKMLKRKESGTTLERLKGAITTGIMMTVATLVALAVALPLSQSQIIQQMFTILIIGLVVDIFATYCFNAGLLVWYLKKRQEY